MNCVKRIKSNMCLIFCMFRFSVPGNTGTEKSCLFMVTNASGFKLRCVFSVIKHGSFDIVAGEVQFGYEHYSPTS